MADNSTSRIGFDAVDALAVLEKLQREFIDYAKAIDSVVASTTNFNSQQGKVDAILKAQALSAKLSSVELARLLRVEKEAAVTSAKLATEKNKEAVALQNAAAARAQVGGIIGGSDTLKGVVDFDKALDGLEQTVVRTGASSQQIQNVLGNLGGSFTGTEREVRDSVVNILRSSNLLQRINTSEGQAALQRLGISAKDLRSVMQTAGRGIQVTWTSVLRIFSLQIIGGIFSKIQSGIRDITSESIALQNSFAEITTIGEGINSSIDGVASQVFELSDAFGQPVEVVSEGLYQTLSNQIDGASDAYTVMAASARLATAAVATQDQAIDLVTSALNVFNLEVSEADDVAAKFFRLVDVGRVRVEELANTFGRLELAAELGVQFDELLASIGTLTLSGIRYNEAFTLINNTLLKLARPTDALKQTFSELGIATAEAGIQAFGFQGFLEKIRDVAGDSATELGEQFGRIRAIRGILGLTGDAADQYNKALQEINNTDLSDLEQAFDRVFLTDAKQIETNLNAIRNQFLGLGRDAQPVLSNLTVGLRIVNSEVIRFGQDFSTSFNAFFGLIGKAGAEVAKLGAQGISFGQLDSNEAALVVGQAAEAVGVLNLRLEETDKISAEAIDTFKKAAQERLKESRNTNNKILANLQVQTIEAFKLYQQDADNAIKEQQRINLEIDGIIGQRQSKLQQIQATLTSAAGDAANEIGRSQDRIFDLQIKREDLLFNRSIRHLSTQQQSVQQRIKAEQLASSAAAQLTKEFQTQEGIERALSGFDRAEQLAEAAKQSALQTNDVVRLANAEQAQVAILNTRIKAEQQLVQLKKQEQVEAEQAAKIQAATLRDFDAQLKLVDAARQAFADAVSGGNAADRAKATKELATEIEKLGQITVDPRLKDNVAIRSLIRDQVNAGFQDLVTGQPVDLATAIQINTNNLEKQLSDAFNNLPENLKTLSIKAGIDRTNFAEQQNFIAKDLENFLNDLSLQASKFEIFKFDPSQGSTVFDNTQQLLDAIEASKAIDNFQQKFGAVNVEAQNIESSVNSIDPSLRAAVKQAIELEKVSRQTKQNFQNTRIPSSDDPSRFAGGGFVTGGVKGQDSVLSLLTPGEFVVREKQARKFSSELSAINHGRSPLRRQSGGSITNNVGGITVIANGTGKIAPKEIAEQIRTELRRKTTRRF